MKRKKVAILFGGCSTEYEVSLQSAYSVITNLNPKKYEAILIGITRQGAWLRFFGALEKIQNNTWMDSSDCVPAIISPDRNIHGLLEFHDDRTVTTRIDVAFPVLHGKNGEDGTLQGLLMMAGIKTPPSIVLRSGFTDAELSKQISCLTFPLFVKPANAGFRYLPVDLFLTPEKKSYSTK